MLLLTKKREELGWSRSELARRAKMTPADVGKIEAGRLRAYSSQLRKLAIALRMRSSEAQSLLNEVEANVEGTQTRGQI